MEYHFFVQNGINMCGLSHGGYIGSHPSINPDSMAWADGAQIQSHLSYLEDVGTTLDAPIVHLTFDLQRRGHHGFGLRFHNFTARIKLIDVVYNAPAFLICLGMPELSTEYDKIAARVARLFADRLAALQNDIPDQSASGLPESKYVLRALLKSGRTMEDESLKVKIKRNGFAMARDQDEYIALPFSTLGWSQLSHLKFCKRNDGWPMLPMKAFRLS